MMMKSQEEGHLISLEGLKMKMKGGGSRRWIVMNASGQEKILDLEKYAIMDRVHIHARDLRILDPVLSYPSAIFGRDRAIVLNLEHIKAIITAKEVFLRDPLEANLTPVVEELRRRLKPTIGNHDTGKKLVALDDDENCDQDELPFEFRVLEVLLEAICSCLAARTMELEIAIYPAVNLLTSKISGHNLDIVHRLKSQMTRLTARVQKVKNELEQLLEDDDDMTVLYLSRKLAGASSPGSGSRAAGCWLLVSPTVGSKRSKVGKPSVSTVRGDEDDVEEIEMLLEAYYMRIDDTLQKLMTLREYIDNTENYINIRLDKHRNQLMKLQVVISTGTLCIATFSLITAIFGMNLKYSWMENHSYMFKWVLVFCGCLCSLCFIYITAYARYRGLL